MHELKHSYTDGFFDVGPEFGFLPKVLPLTELPVKYSALQNLIDKMPVFLPNGEPGYLNYPDQIVKEVELLPNYYEAVLQETDIKNIQALYRDYCFIASAYTLEPSFQHFRKTGEYGKARTRLPIQIAQPFVEVSKKLNAYPWLDYHYAYSLGNYKLKKLHGGLEWSNLDMCVRFSGQPDEVGFIMLHVDINQFSPKLVATVMNTLDAAWVRDIEKVEMNLHENLSTLEKMNIRRKEMWKASRWQHYNDFRIFIMGIKGNEALFGDGVIYTGVSEEPMQYRGQTGAQDDIIPMEDIFSGVIRYYPGNELTKYLFDLRNYRPKCIQQFFIDLEHSVTSIHPEGLMGFLKDHKSKVGLAGLLGILEQIYYFRNGHWQFVQKYIMANTAYAHATGGTPITSWLPNQLKAVLQQMEDVLKIIDILDHTTDSKSQLIIEHNKNNLPHKKKLLEEQLLLVSEQQFSPNKIFDLNEKFGLKDE